jgi:hypothetical protein
MAVLRTRAALFAGATLLAPLPAFAQTADPIGVTSAVNPDARGVRPDGVQNTLLVGSNVIFRERIETGPSGQVQLLFNDQSSISVGPNAQLVIDQFVYDPATGAGQMAVSLARGTMRFVGGKISKRNEVAIATPSATLGIRGGMTMPTVADDGSTRVVHVFGTTTVRTADGQSATLTRPGFVAEIAAPRVPVAGQSAPAAPGQAQPAPAPGGATAAPGEASAAPAPPPSGGISVRRATDAEISATKSQLEAGPVQQTARAQPQAAAPSPAGQQAVGQTAPGPTAQAGGPAAAPGAGPAAGPGGAPRPPPGGAAIDGALGGSGMAGRNSAVAPGQIGTVGGLQPGPPPLPPVQQAAQAAQAGGQIANTNTAAQTTATSAIQQTLQGFSLGFSLAGRARFGTWLQGPGTFASRPDFDNATKSKTFSANLTNGKLTGTLSDGQTFGLNVPYDAAGRFFGAGAGSFSPGGALSGSTFLASSGRFMFGHYTLANGERLAIFGGTPVSGSALMSTSSRVVREYSLRADPASGSNIPFLLTPESGGNFSNPYVSPIVLVTPAAGGQSARFMQTSFAVDGSGTSQRSVLSVMTGSIFNDSAGNLAVSGGARAIYDMTGNQRPGRYGFGATSETDAGGNSFFGTLSADGAPSNFVLGQNTIDNSNVRGTDDAARNLAIQTSGTDNYYRFSVPATFDRVNASSPAPTTTFFNGYAAGLTERNGGTNVVRQISNDPTQTVIRFNAANNTVTALLAVERVGSAESFQLGFGARPNSFTGGATSLASSTVLANIRDSGYTTFAADNARAALIDTKTWAAREMINPGAGFGTDGSPNSAAALVTSNLTNSPASVTDEPLQARLAMVPSTAIGSSVLSAAFPSSTFSSYESMQWGFWTGQVTFPNPLVTGGRTDRYSLATWVAGVLPALGDIPATGTATYNGHAIGTVDNNGARYTASGTYTQTWNFGSDSGTATIANFDGLGNVTATLSSANRREFTGSLSNGSGVTGDVKGSFFRGTSDAVKNVGGNFNLSGTNYKAGGIVVGQR